MILTCGKKVLARTEHPCSDDFWLRVLGQGKLTNLPRWSTCVLSVAIDALQNALRKNKQCRTSTLQSKNMRVEKHHCF